MDSHGGGVRINMELEGGLPFMRGSFFLSQVLKAEDLYRSNRYFFNMGRFSSVTGQGRTGGSKGGRVLIGHERGPSPWTGTPSFLHCM